MSGNCQDCYKCTYPIPKKKKYQSYQDLLFDRQVCQIIERANTNLPYRDTQERLATQKAKDAFTVRINQHSKVGKARCLTPWYY